MQCLHLMYAEIAWVLLSSRTQVQPQVILDTDYLPDYLSVSYDYDQRLSPVLNTFFFQGITNSSCYCYTSIVLHFF